MSNAPGSMSLILYLIQMACIVFMLASAHYGNLEWTVFAGFLLMYNSRYGT
jgi:hypothetical protein